MENYKIKKIWSTVDLTKNMSRDQIVENDQRNLKIPSGLTLSEFSATLHLRTFFTRLTDSVIFIIYYHALNDLNTNSRSI